MKLLLKTPLNPHSGYGNDGIALALAFRYAGVDVYLDPSNVQPPLPQDVTDLLTKRLEGPFDLLIQHWAPQYLEISDATRRACSVTAAHSMWEMSSLDNCDGRSTLRKRLKNFDLVVGYDQNSTQAFERYVTGSAATVQGGYWARQWPAIRRNWDAETLNFCMVGQLGPRKDPFVTIEAFRELRAERPDLKIALSLKTNSPGLHSKMMDVIPGLTIHYAVWPEETMRAFYASQHVLLAPSRGEGKNLPALEMLSTGGTVIATNWGGHTQWLSPAIGYPLDYQLEPMSLTQPNCLWAKASKDHLKQLMLHAYENRSELERKGELAAQLIPDMCDWERTVDRFMERVGELGERGERVLHKYRVAKARIEENRMPVMM